MLDDTPTYGSIAPLRNVRALAELIERVQERADGLPGMACFHGPSGYGKTSAAAFAVNRHQAHHVQVKSMFTVNSTRLNLQNTKLHYKDKPILQQIS